MQAPTSATGQATTTAFNEHFMTKLRDQVNALKRICLWREGQIVFSIGDGYVGGGGGAFHQAPDGKGGMPNKNVKGGPEGGAPGGGGGAGAAVP
jgi:hypothetical protein